jgi:succinate-acetate transporter protein
MLEPQAETAVVDEARRRVEGLTRITVRPIGSPTGLGLFGLAAATLVLAGLQLGWAEQAEGKKVALILFAFPFLAQLLASIWSTLARDGVAATAMGVLALTWLATALVLFSSKPGQTSDALGLLLLFSAAAMALTALVATLSKIAIGLIFFTAALRFFLGGMHQLTANEAWENAAGVVGLLLCALAIYGAFAAELEDAQGETVLPIGRRMKGRLALDGSLDEQMKQAPNEPGVRQQL